MAQSDSKLDTTTNREAVAANWAIGSSRQSSKNLYALALISDSDQSIAGLNDTTISSIAQLALQKGADALEFVFDVNPNSMTLDEPAAVTIVPTQDGGQFVEHQGSIYKDISLTGTTGLRPGSRGKAAITPFFGFNNSLAKDKGLDPATGLPVGESSGFDALLRLRNLFRTYFDVKRNPDLAHKVRMVWQNGKEGEFYIVEPTTFRTKRDSSNPLTSNYEIQMRTIRRLDLKLEARVESRAKRTGLPNFIERTTKYTASLSSALRRAESLVDRTVGIAQATLNTVIAPANAVLDGITGVVVASNKAFDIPRNSVGLLAASALNLVDELQRTQAQANAYKTEGITTQFARSFKAFKDILRVAAAIFSEDNLYARALETPYTDRAAAYTDPAAGQPSNGGSPTNLNNVRPPSSTRLVTVRDYDTIFSVALRELGDQARWKEIVILNNLKAPYLDSTGDGKDVLRPKDRMLIPTASTQGVAGVEQDLSAQEDKLVQRLGRDLRLEAVESVAGFNIYDIAKDSKGDMGRIEGVPNLQQSIQIKFRTEQGTLPTHPTFGIQAPVGSKAVIRSLIGYQLNARATLLADSRIGSVRRFNFQLDGNVLLVKANVQVANIDESVSVNFEARR